MSVFQRLKYLHLAYLSKPAGRRRLYRAIKRYGFRSIVQVGVTDVRLAEQLVRTAGMATGDAAQVSYTGIDLFEARLAARTPIRLKTAHQVLSRTGARIKLVPGTPFDGLARTANSLLGTDLVVISAEAAKDMSQAWFYLPRMLHKGSLVFQAHPGDSDEDEPTYEVVAHAEIQRMAGQACGQRAA